MPAQAVGSPHQGNPLRLRKLEMAKIQTQSVRIQPRRGQRLRHQRSRRRCLERMLEKFRICQGGIGPTHSNRYTRPSHRFNGLCAAQGDGIGQGIYKRHRIIIIAYYLISNQLQRRSESSIFGPFQFVLDGSVGPSRVSHVASGGVVKGQSHERSRE